MSANDLPSTNSYTVLSPSPFVQSVTMTSTNPNLHGSSFEYRMPQVEAAGVSLDASGGVLVGIHGGAVRIDPRFFKDLMTLIQVATLAQLVPPEPQTP